MRPVIAKLSLLICLLAAPTLVMAQMETLSITVSFRERIALPPGAQLDVQIFDSDEAKSHVGPIAAQRFAMITVPMPVSLTYDPQIVNDDSPLTIFAAIRGPDGQQLFRATKTFDSLQGSTRTNIEMILTMLSEAESHVAVPRRISGVSWTVTEVFGDAWPNDEPATLVIDDEMNLAAFAGCNRFMGRVAPGGRRLAFPENMAGTIMACPDDVEAAERRFLAALMQVSDYVRYGAGLVMTDADGLAVLHFVETPE